jgi:hypothetical protein
MLAVPRAASVCRTYNAAKRRAKGAVATTQNSFGRYELRGELGWGGFATVYRAWDPALRREVAVKALMPHLARVSDLRRRFLAEAQALARLQHPNIVPVFDVGEAEDRPFFAMALVDGQTVAATLAASKHLPLSQVVDLLQSLASALDELHSHGLVHRDVKPQNVMIDRSGRVVLMDLGIARSLDSTSVTQTGSSLGTPQYMAPEQARGQRVGPAADIYALGILSYHLLADRPPFLGDTPSVLHAQAYDQPPPLRELRPDLPESVYRAIDAALSKDPEQRPASAGQFVEMLRDTEPTSVLPRTPTSSREIRSTELLRPSEARPPAPARRWLLPVLGGAVALVLVAGLAALYQSRQGPDVPVAPASPVSGQAAAPAAPRGVQTVAASPGARSGTVPRLVAPSTDCAPPNPAPGATTACSVFLDGDVSAGSVITVTVTGPQGAKVSNCHSVSGGLLCGETAGNRLSVACRQERCLAGSQFTVDITASGRGPLIETIGMQSPAGAASSFPFSGKATFGSP